jgi:hypothetical protein
MVPKPVINNSPFKPDSKENLTLRGTLLLEKGRADSVITACSPVRCLTHKNSSVHVLEHVNVDCTIVTANETNIVNIETKQTRKLKETILIAKNVKIASLKEICMSLFRRHFQIFSPDSLGRPF